MKLLGFMKKIGLWTVKLLGYLVCTLAVLNIAATLVMDGCAARARSADAHRLVLEWAYIFHFLRSAISHLQAYLVSAVLLVLFGLAALWASRRLEAGGPGG